MSRRASRTGERFSVTRLNPKESLHTTHLSVLDENGMAVSTTHSLGMVSGAITKGLGFLYNGAMGIFDPRPGQPGSIAPGKRRFTAACPTIVFEDGRPKIVIGRAGRCAYRGGGCAGAGQHHSISR